MQKKERNACNQKHPSNGRRKHNHFHLPLWMFLYGVRKQLVHLKYSGQDFVHQIKCCICFDAQQSDRLTENLKDKA
ncbi:hypothetical protein [Nostoc commune]|uniref:hypothetical protein n=1 Tax=Nostoc commune TaxID=1178 RepID=UPI0011B2179C|nr:hypothetical protein [Nostoc commune]